MQLPNSEIDTSRIRGTVKQRQPWWLVSIWVLLGVLLDWRCAFEWFEARYSYFSVPVLRRAALVAVACAILALMLARLTRARLRDAASVFALASLLAYSQVHASHRIWRYKGGAACQRGGAIYRG